MSNLILAARSVLLSLGMLLVGAACTRSDCGNDVVGEVVSPSGKYVATMFMRNCGATTDVVSVVALRSAGAKFDAEDREQYVLTMRGEYPVTAEWQGDQHLVIHRQAASQDIFVEVTKWKDVAIAMDGSKQM